MKTYSKLFVKHIKKLINSKIYRAKILYAQGYTRPKPLKESILFETYAGDSISGNGYIILQTIYNTKVEKGIKIYVAAKTEEKKKIQKFLHNKNMNCVEVVSIHSLKYIKCLLECKYLFNNATFPTYYIKREGQVYINTWHGTPLKNMGRSILDGPEKLGNTQRNFEMADYVFYPNQYTKDIMLTEYMLDNDVKHMVTGYPRNISLTNSLINKEIRQKLKLQNKTVICYLPTWRAKSTLSIDKTTILENHLNMLDLSLKEDQLLYIKLHNYEKNDIDITQYTNIRFIPEEFETYEFLSIADCLITDYSSVMFDFAYTGKKIILFTYDKDEYFSNRGVYQDVADMPFTIVENIMELTNGIKDVTEYDEYKEFINMYCYKDSNIATDHIIELWFGKDMKSSSEFNEDKRESVLIYGGGLAKNGITTALKGLLKVCNDNDKKYVLLFYAHSGARYRDFIHNLPENIQYIPIQGRKLLTFKEIIIHFMYGRLKICNPYTEKVMENIYSREAKRLFGENEFDYVINFSGYEYRMTWLIECINSLKKIIYLHSDMKKESKTRNNFHVKALQRAYKNSDVIVGVREGMELYGDVDYSCKMTVAHNINDIEGILRKSELKLEFNEGLESTHSMEEIHDILNDSSATKFINVGRYSQEKGLNRLIDAFDTIEEENKYLFIIGGHGATYNEVLLHATETDRSRIVLIKSMDNLFPILKKCDAMVVSSFYEGLPMCIMEALILDVDVICTDIQGPREFLEQGYGVLVENTTEGISNGMTDYCNGKRASRKFDEIAFNERAVQEFEGLFVEN